MNVIEDSSSNDALLDISLPADQLMLFLAAVKVGHHFSSSSV
jgi:hypothetical protein